MTSAAAGGGGAGGAVENFRTPDLGAVGRCVEEAEAKFVIARGHWQALRVQQPTLVADQRRDGLDGEAKAGKGREQPEVGAQPIG